MTAASFAIGAAEQFNGDFYATIATVIPVLIALLFFEGRVHEKFVEREYAAISGSIGIVLLVVAETNALHVLYHRESPERVQLALIVVAIFWGLTTLVIGAVYERVYEYAPEYEFAATIALPLIGMATGVVGLVAGASLIVALSIVVLTLSFLTIPLFALSRFRSRRAKQDRHAKPPAVDPLEADSQETPLDASVPEAFHALANRLRDPRPGGASAVLVEGLVRGGGVRQNQDSRPDSGADGHRNLRHEKCPRAADTAGGRQQEVES